MTTDSAISIAKTLSRLREQVIAQLDKYVRERGQRERLRFTLAQDNHKILVEQFLESYADLTDKQIRREFARAFAADHDGVIRNRPDQFDIQTQPGVYIGKDVDVTPEIKRRVVTARMTCQRLGPAWRTRFQNTYVTMPENIMVIFWPEVRWCADAGPELSIPDEEYGWIADVAHNPQRSSAWTGLFYDSVAGVWMVSCETPIDVDGEHVATVGHDVTLDELLDRAVHDHLPGAYNIIFRPDGRLIAHPLLVEDIKKQDGYFDIAECDDRELQSIFSQVIERNADGVIEDRSTKTFLAVTHIEGPDWYFVVVVPEKTLMVDELTSDFEDQEARFRSLFEDSPLSLWEEDYSQVRIALDEIIQSGVTDLRAHFREHPGLASELGALIKVENVNQATLDLYGATTTDEFLGSLAHILGEASDAELAGQLAALAEGDRTYEAETVLYRFNGETGMSLVSASIAPGSEKSWSKVFVSVVDITDRTEMDRLLEESEARMSAILESASDGVITMDGEGRVLLWNPRATELFGYDRDEMLGQPLAAIIPERFRQSHHAGFRRLTAGGEPRVIGGSVELTGLHREGHEFPIELSLGTWERGSDRFFSGIIRDISERKEAQSELEATNEKLNAAREAADVANEAKSSFLANMSHELRTPMNAIIGYSEMLAEDAEDEGHDEMAADLQKINAAGTHLLSLINNVLDLSKIESGKMEIFVETFDLRALLDDSITTLEPLVAKNDNRLVADYDEDLGTMQADATKLRQSLFNLVSNASKFTEQGTITLTARRYSSDEMERVRLDVADTGIGIPQDKLDRVFEEFGQADDSTSRDYGGTGLGLPISRNFCQMMGGDITVTSEVGVGSTFTIDLPAIVEEAADDDTGEGASIVERDEEVLVAADAADGTILVIDDDANARDLLTRSLEKAGHVVVSAPSAQEGLELARLIRPALITLDIEMPDMNGWEVLGVIKAEEDLKNIPVVMVSVAEDRETATASKAIDWLTKPVDRDVLLKVVRRHVTAANSLVLVVEDDPDVAELVRRSLTEAGFRVAVAHNGIEGLERVSDEAPGLILADLMMPVMDGFEFVSILRAQPQHAGIPVVVVTAKDLSVDERDRLEGDVESIIEKRDGWETELLSRVAEVIPGSPVDRGSN